jgi:hypothetical protein
MNASTALPNETLDKSYAAAVGSDLCVAFELATFVQKRYAPDQARKLLRFVVFPSAAVASSMNCYIVRSPEIGTDILLINDRNEEVLSGETSVIAAKRECTQQRHIGPCCKLLFYSFHPCFYQAFQCFKRYVFPAFGIIWFCSSSNG